MLSSQWPTLLHSNPQHTHAPWIQHPQLLLEGAFWCLGNARAHLRSRQNSLAFSSQTQQHWVGPRTTFPPKRQRECKHLGFRQRRQSSPPAEVDCLHVKYRKGASLLPILEGHAVCARHQSCRSSLTHNSCPQQTFPEKQAYAGNCPIAGLYLFQVLGPFFF